MKFADFSKQRSVCQALELRSPVRHLLHSAGAQTLVTCDSIQPLKQPRQDRFTVWRNNQLDHSPIAEQVTACARQKLAEGTIAVPDGQAVLGRAAYASMSLGYYPVH